MADNVDDSLFSEVLFDNGLDFDGSFQMDISDLEGAGIKVLDVADQQAQGDDDCEEALSLCGTSLSSCEAQNAALSAQNAVLSASAVELQAKIDILCGFRIPSYFSYSTQRDMPEASTGSGRDRHLYQPWVSLQLNPYDVSGASPITWTTGAADNYLYSVRDSYPRINTPFGDGTGQVDLQGRFNGDCVYELFTNFGRRVGVKNLRSGIDKTSTVTTVGAQFFDQQNGDQYGCFYTPSGGSYSQYATITMSYNTGTPFNDASPLALTGAPTINIKKASDPFGTWQTTINQTVSDDYEVVVTDQGEYSIVGTFSVIGTDAGGNVSIDITNDPCE